MSIEVDLLWKPLLEASAQTIVGAVGGYAFSSLLERITRRNHFDGPMDLWKRGIGTKQVQLGDQIYIDGLISPYAQLFPGNPFENGRRWSELYTFEGKISSDEYQALDFSAGNDAALRVGSLNGETVVGVYARYGYIGEGLFAVAPTTMIRKQLPDFFEPSFYGMRARIGGILSRCPAQHGFVAQRIAMKAGLHLNLPDYEHLYYLEINSIKPQRKGDSAICSLIGSPWAVTADQKDQYLVQYGYFDDRTEMQRCRGNITGSSAWDRAAVFFDEIDTPAPGLSFKRQFIL